MVMVKRLFSVEKHPLQEGEMVFLLNGKTMCAECVMENETPADLISHADNIMFWADDECYVCRSCGEQYGGNIDR